MSSVVMERPVDQPTDRLVIMEAAETTADPPARRSRGPLVWLASIVAWVLAPPERDQRGITTIEYIFGAILAIAIITVVVTVIRNPAVGELVLKLIEWALKFRGK